MQIDVLIKLIRKKMITFSRLVSVHKQSIIKEGSNEGFLNTFIFRKISIIFSYILATLNFNPNVISLIAFLLNIFGGVLLVINYNFFMLHSILLIACGHILDMSDGEVARLTNKKSAFGAFLDPFLDRIMDLLLPLLVGFAYFFSYIHDGRYYFIFLISLFSSLLMAHSYLDKTSYIMGLNAPIDGIKNNINKLKYLDSFIKYLKWDGGFTILLYAISIYFKIIPVLLIFLVIFLFVICVNSFYRIRKKLNSKK